MLRHTICGVAALVFTACGVFSGAAGQDSARAPIQLFNGRDLSNFYTWLVDHKHSDPDQVFGVVPDIDGAPAIRVSGQHFGGFITKEEYSNYRLVAEFRWGKKTWGARERRTKDSGILLHCQGRDGNTAKDFNGPWMRSQEFQIIEGGVGDFILVGGFDEQGMRIVPSLTATVSKDRDGETVYDPMGMQTTMTGGRINWFGRDVDWKDEIGFRGRNDVESPDGSWTRIEAICERDTITNIVNGKVVNRGTKSTLTRGKILFQSELAEIYFRKIELTPLGTARP